MNIRKVEIRRDAQAICDIYNYYIVNTAITFETESLTETEMKNRISGIVDAGFDYYVGEVNGKIIGYYYTRRWNSRSAYAYSLEESIYLDKDEVNKGYGVQLFEHLLKQTSRSDVHVLIACITIPNESSVRLHEKFGFKQASHMKEVGWKFNQWRDVGHWVFRFPELS